MREAGNQKAPEQDQPTQARMGEFALYAQFLAENALIKAVERPEGSLLKQRSIKEADEAAAMAKIFQELVVSSRSFADASKEIDDSITYYGKRMMEAGILNDDSDKAQRQLDAYSAAQQFLDQNSGTDFFMNVAFNTWSTERIVHATQARADEEREQTARGKEGGEIDEIRERLGVDDSMELEELRDKAAALVLQEGGVRIHTSIRSEILKDGMANHYAGFQSLETRINDGGYPKSIRSKMEVTFFSQDELVQGLELDNVLKERGINELIDIRAEKKEIYEDITVPGKRGLFGLGRVKEHIEKRPTGRYKSVPHSEVVEGGKKDEPAVRFTYYIPQLKWKDYSGRPGQMMVVEIILPQSEAKELESILQNDPAAMREVVAQVMSQKFLKEPKDWTKKQGHGDSLRPPYEKWDSEGRKIHVQKADPIENPTE